MSNLDNYIRNLEPELRTGGGATLDELFNLALAVNEDLRNLHSDRKTKKTQAQAMRALHEQGWSLRDIADLFGYNHPGSVKYQIESTEADTTGTDLLTDSPKANSRTSEAQSGAGEKGRS